MSEPKSIHEPRAQLLSAQDAIRDAERLQALLLRNRQRAEREVQLRVPFTVIIEAVDQLEADELRLLAQRLEERLAGMQRWAIGPHGNGSRPLQPDPPLEQICNWEGNTMSQVFISYNHNDGDFADNLKEKIKKAGFEPWIDITGLRAGEDWRAEIDQAIKEASALIVVMTPKAKESEYVTYEWAFAWGAGVRMIPILFKPTELHPRLEALQYLDFTNRMARPWDKLLEALQEAIDHASQTIRVPPDVPPEIKRVITGAIAALDSASPAERKAAVATLAQTDHPAAREALAKAVQHPVRDVRIHAAFALVQFKDARAVPALIEALRDKDESMRAFAAAALGHIGDAAAVPNLTDALRDEEWPVAWAAAEALGKIGDAAAVPSLINALQNRDIDVHEAIVEALEQIGTPEALAAVEEWDARRPSKTGRPIKTIGPSILKDTIL